MGITAPFLDASSTWGILGNMNQTSAAPHALASDGTLIDLGGENRDILLGYLLSTLRAEGKPVPHVEETRSSKRGRPWYKLTWEHQPDLVMRINNRGYYRLQEDSNPVGYGTFARAADAVEPLSSQL